MQLKKITFCIALAFTPGAFAAESTLPEVVVTAPAMEQPLVVTTDPRKPRQPIPAHDGADYLKTIPGFSVIRKGGTDGDPVFRGMAGSRLNILLDGEQILGGCSGRMDPPTAYIFPSSYDKITVLKGPQTVIYGPGSSAGTVLFERNITRRSDTGAGFDGSATTGSSGRTDLMGDVQGGSPDWYARAIATNSRAGDYKDGNGVSVHSAYSRWSANAAIGLTPSDGTRIELSMARSDGHAAYADRTVDGSKFARDNVGLKADWKNPDHGLLGKVEAQFFRNYIDHVMDSYSLRAGGNPASMMAAMNPDRTTTGGRIAGTLNFSDATQLKLGLDAQSNVHTGRTGAAPGYMGDYTLQARIEDANFQNHGLFGEVTHQLGNDARIVGGLRADWWKAQDKRATVSRGMAAAAANPTANLARSDTLTSGFARYERDVLGNAGTFYAGLGHTERSPDYWELLYKHTATTLSAFNTVRPEKTTQLDVGMTYKQGDISGSLSGFYSKITDFNLIESACKTTAANALVGLASSCGMGQYAVSMTRNISATTWGGEASAAWQFAPQWKVDGSLAYVRGSNDTDGTALAQISPLEGRLGAAYDNGTCNIGGLLRMVAAQDRFVANQGNIAGQDIGRTAGFGVLSLNASWRASKSVLVSAGVDNLADRVYAEHISRAGAMVTGFTQTTRVNEMGRNLWLKANLKFD
ncbi:TonB-dependent copper receptor [Candidatus Ferrigenium straubiae]|jgi:iron complex outermembrane receptor protein|uniref:TonB-dependent copper receptor n=1 Tax=Candidatus Ferrigenium straubiae TaxID=2919506 RepID=UPI003F4A8BD7